MNRGKKMFVRVDAMHWDVGSDRFFYLEGYPEKLLSMQMKTPYLNASYGFNPYKILGHDAG